MLVPQRSFNTQVTKEADSITAIIYKLRLGRWEYQLRWHILDRLAHFAMPADPVLDVTWKWSLIDVSWELVKMYTCKLNSCVF